MKRFYRSETNKVWKGILGGMGEYFDVDPVLIRVVYIFVMIVSGVIPGLIAYVVAIFIVPKRPKIGSAENTSDENKTSN